MNDVGKRGDTTGQLNDAYEECMAKGLGLNNSILRNSTEDWLNIAVKPSADVFCRKNVITGMCLYKCAKLQTQKYCFPFESPYTTTTD